MLTDMSTIQGYGGAYYVLTAWPLWIPELFNKNIEQSKHGTGGLSDMAAKTVNNCQLIKKMVAEGVGTPKIFSDGTCDGYADWNEDEPCEKCKICKLNTWYEED